MYRWSWYIPDRDRAGSLFWPQGGGVRIQPHHFQAILQIGPRNRPLGNSALPSCFPESGNPLLPSSTHLPSLFLLDTLYLLHCHCDRWMGPRLPPT